MSVSRHVASRMILTLAVFNMPLGIDLFNVHKSDRKPYPPNSEGSRSQRGSLGLGLCASFRSSCCEKLPGKSTNISKERKECVNRDEASLRDVG